MNTGWNDNGTPDDSSDDFWVGNADYRLQATSPCIDAGAPDVILPPDTADLDKDGDTVEPTPLDIDGNARLYDGIVDIGAYEHQPFCPGDFDYDGDVDGLDLLHYISNQGLLSLEDFSKEYGRFDCW